MHRVELKALKPCLFQLISTVPNAPCGVERFIGSAENVRAYLIKFLMHRVELKDGQGCYFGAKKCLVPNAPCGVERWSSL